MLSPSEKAERSKQLFDALRYHVNGTPTNKGEVWIKCPSCGKSKKFSFSRNGANCFSCGFKPSLKVLADQLGLRDHRPYTAPREVEQPRPAPKPWQLRANELAENYAADPRAGMEWHTYKPVSHATRQAHRLGLGILPACACRHARLIVPLYRDGQCVGFRGRRLACACPQKWISPAGSEMTLYNAEAIVPGRPVTVVENPVDALLLGERWGEIAVATLGVSIWKDGYTDLVRPAGEVTVAFDNDAPGNATRPDIIWAWEQLHPGVLAPQCGVKLANRLLSEGVPARLYDWGGAPAGSDWGDLLCRS